MVSASAPPQNLCIVPEVSSLGVRPIKALVQSVPILALVSSSPNKKESGVTVYSEICNPQKPLVNKEKGYLFPYFLENQRLTHFLSNTDFVILFFDHLIHCIEGFNSSTDSHEILQASSRRPEIDRQWYKLTNWKILEIQINFKKNSEPTCLL